MAINFGKMKRGRSTKKSGLYFLNDNYEVLYIECMGDCKQRKEVGEYGVNSGTKRIKLANFGEEGKIIHVPRYRTKCKRCEGSYYSEWQRTSTKWAEYHKNYYEVNKVSVIAWNHNHRARKLGLPAELTGDIVTTMREEQQGRCILSGLTDIEFEHTVPLSKGGGSTFGNCYFVNEYLNKSKGDRNIFEWIKEQLNFVQRRFYNVFVPMMAERNGMTPKEYEEFIYSLHEAKKETV
ncbi:hypothetical protein [Bacillus haynesii]|uniref:hypothetical protein n=1 Tax=Bacillus haynesii TaxID=1925021 RepID=UPI002282A3A6|nr:hypothetical protein [Bacillus haynesii]MCY7861598.1 hypothetical protein [Bacillus haynesii]MCY9153912.1 hypothetical protein [Bacillus haynesii]